MCMYRYQHANILPTFAVHGTNKQQKHLLRTKTTNSYILERAQARDRRETATGRCSIAWRAMPPVRVSEAHYHHDLAGSQVAQRDGKRRLMRERERRQAEVGTCSTCLGYGSPVRDASMCTRQGGRTNQAVAAAAPTYWAPYSSTSSS